jgi:hypothetical protein
MKDRSENGQGFYPSTRKNGVRRGTRMGRPLFRPILLTYLRRQTKSLTNGGTRTSLIKTVGFPGRGAEKLDEME